MEKGFGGSARRPPVLSGDDPTLSPVAPLVGIALLREVWRAPGPLHPAAAIHLQCRYRAVRGLAPGLQL